MFRTVIVPLNGSASAEAAVPYAVDQASRQGATIVLVRVIARPELSPSFPRRGGPRPHAPIWPADELAAEERQAYIYLEGVARRFHLPAGSEAVVPVGDPLLRLVAEIRRRPAPMVIVTAAEVAGSAYPAPGGMAHRLLLAGLAPILVVQVPERATAPAGTSAEIPAEWTHGAPSSSVPVEPWRVGAIRFPMSKT